jgi:putative membrane protein
MTYLQQMAYIMRCEAGQYLRWRKLRLAAWGVVLLPSLYALIYLSSLWDPSANTQALTVALVNLDDGIDYKDHFFNVGGNVTARLKDDHRFSYVDLHDADEAKRQVRRGTLAFALIIPKDFSSNAIPGAQPGDGKLVVYTAEGNSYETGVLARQFANELGHSVNENLNERRWALVLNSAAGSQRSVDRLRSGVSQLQHGAKSLEGGAQQTATASKALSTGAAKLQGGVAQLTDGMRQLGGGLRTMDAKRPAHGDLKRLQTGAESLAAGHQELGEGLDALQLGAQKMAVGAGTLRDQAADSALLPSSVKEATTELASGADQLNAGVKTASAAQHQLADGAEKLSAGVVTLTTGVRALTNGVRTMVSKLPEDAVLDELNQGASALANGNFVLADGLLKVRAGSQALNGGLDLLATSLPQTMDTPGGSAAGMASSVHPVMEVAAPVSNSGSGFAPNVLPAALWLGAGLAAFLIQARTLPRRAHHFVRPVQMLGKMGLPSIVVLAQALVLGALTHWVLKVPISNGLALMVTLAVTSLSFLAMVLLLTKALGDAGKALAMVLLAVQMSSSGGVMPVELSGSLFAEISPFLPMTWVVKAVKASLFGAFDGNWLLPLARVAAWGAAALVAAMWVGPWRFVKASAMRPPVDL